MLSPPLDGRLGVVAIGRNEGFRLRLCLESLEGFDAPVIYVDSNSVDDSVAVAMEMGVEVLELDPAKPFSAARARREGYRTLLDSHPELEYVFFVDGDCQVDPDWLRTAQEFLRVNDDVAAVCGRRREQHPEHTVYNRLCDHEWDTDIGESISVGGDAVYRCAAYLQAGEFDPTVTAGEEPELCKRIRDHGWKIWRLDEEMTVHNAAMTSLGQWWRRQIRTGYAGYDVERRFQLGIFNRIINSACFWGFFVPTIVLVVSLTLGWYVSPWLSAGCLALAAVAVLLQIVRVARQLRVRDYNWQHSLMYGFFTMAAKVPILLGAAHQAFETAIGRKAQLVEYKSSERIPSQPKSSAG